MVDVVQTKLAEIKPNKEILDWIPTIICIPYAIYYVVYTTPFWTLDY